MVLIVNRVCSVMDKIPLNKNDLHSELVLDRNERNEIYIWPLSSAHT